MIVSLDRTAEAEKNIVSLTTIPGAADSMPGAVDSRDKVGLCTMFLPHCQGSFHVQMARAI